MPTQILFLVAGLMLLVKGADYLVEGGSEIAKRFKISPIVIGLTIVAFGTSAPELVVNILSALQGSAELALGNINGSNIANILLILGASALISHIPVRSRTVVKEMPFMLLAGVMMMLFLLDPLISQAEHFELSRMDGIALLGFFAVFMYYLVLSARQVSKKKLEKPKRKTWIAIGMTIMGLLGLMIGARLTVDSATSIALAIGISEGLIAVSVIAIGTSLPELVSSLVAAKKGEMDMAVGGIIGSNVFNILMVVGITATISPSPLQVGTDVVWDSLFAFIAMIILFFTIFVDQYSKDKFTSTGISRFEGAGFLLLYIVYIIYIVLRG